MADEVWQYRTGNLTIFDKDYDTAIAKVLAAKHTASLQLLCTVSGNQARLDARTEFKNLEPSLKEGWKLVVYITVEALYRIEFGIKASGQCGCSAVIVLAPHLTLRYCGEQQQYNQEA